MKMKAVTAGVICAVSPVPLFLFTVFWSQVCLALGFMIWDTVPDWLLCVALMPLAVSPLMGIGGIVYGVVRRKELLAWLGVLLSSLSLVMNAALWYGMYYVGSRF